MTHSTILVWPEGPCPPVVARRVATLEDGHKRRFIRFEHRGKIGIAPEENVTRLDKIFPHMTGAEISPDVGTS